MKRKFNIGNEARAIARERIGQPSKTKVREDKRRKLPKHKNGENSEHTNA